MFGKGVPGPLPVGAIAAILLLFSVLAADAWKGKVVGITDGDTIRLLKDGKEVKIRLHGVDTPEEGQPFGTRAKQFTSALVYGKEVRAEVVEKDKYGREVADIYLEDGRCLNHELVRHGFAWWYRHYASGDTVLAKLEQQARETTVGLWADEVPVPPWDWRKGERGRKVETPASDVSAGSQEVVFRTRTGAKYHLAGCRYLKSTIQTTVGEAAGMGLMPCSVCGPPRASSVGLNQAEMQTPLTPRSSAAPSYSGRCQATTKKGSQCKRSARSAGYCWQHGG